MQVTILEYGDPIGADAERMVSKTVKWHRRPGKIKSYKSTSGSSVKRVHYTKKLVENAMAMGWLNGVRIRKR